MRGQPIAIKLTGYIFNQFDCIIGTAITVIITGLGISILSNEPKDTFDNPYLAYAELEKAFAMMSDGMKKGLDMVETSESVIKKSTEIFK